MSLRPASLQLNNSPTIILKPCSFSFVPRTQPPGSFRRLHLRNGLVRCSKSGTAAAASSRIIALDWRNVALPYSELQSSNYGRYAYQDVSGDDSDYEFGSPQSQSQMVGFLDTLLLDFCKFSIFFLLLFIFAAVKLEGGEEFVVPFNHIARCWLLQWKKNDFPITY